MDNCFCYCFVCDRVWTRHICVCMLCHICRGTCRGYCGWVSVDNTTGATFWIEWGNAVIIIMNFKQKWCIEALHPFMITCLRKQNAYSTLTETYPPNRLYKIIISFIPSTLITQTSRGCGSSQQQKVLSFCAQCTGRPSREPDRRARCCPTTNRAIRTPIPPRRWRDWCGWARVCVSEWIWERERESGWLGE